MLVLSFLTFALFTSNVFAWRREWKHNRGRGRSKCLCQNDVDDILTNWVALFEKKDPAGIADLAADTVTDDFSLTDETINFLFGIEPSPGTPYPFEGPYVSNKQAFIQSLSFEGSSTKDASFDRVFVEYNCDSITFRWQYKATAVGPTAQNPNNTATAGDFVRYKGIDVLQIKKGTKLIQKVTSSADWLWLFYLSGERVVFQKNVPSTQCLTPFNQ